MDDKGLSNIETIISNIYDFSVILELYGLNYETDEHHLFVGSVPSQGDQIIIISVIRSEMSQLLLHLVPVFMEEKLTFHLVKDKQVAKWVLRGLMGMNNVGKLIILFLSKDCDFVRIMGKLIDVTRGYKGPAVPNHLHLGGLLYTESAEAEAGLKRVEINDPKIRRLKDKYFLFSNRKHDIIGDIFIESFTKMFFWPVKCIIKEGKASMGSDDAERDMKDRLQWQKKIHQDLNGLINVPKIIDLFDNN